MTVNPSTQNQEQVQETTKTNDAEINFRKQQKMYERMLEEERAARVAAEKLAQERSAPKPVAAADDEDDYGDEPYIDRKVLARRLSRFEKEMEQKIDKKAEEKARGLLDQERKNQWMKNNPDFYEVMQHAQAFADRDPELAETILEMPDSFERQKLVYKNIKALGVHKKEEPKSNIQETINKNQRNPYYQPTGTGAPPYGMVAGGKDYSPSEMKNAHQKMKELQSKLRI